MNTNEFYHHGVLGMKWGVRRYQNEDGTLTSTGKKRKRQQRLSDDAKVAYELKQKKVGEMSNAELRKLNERQQLEAQYKNLNPSFVKKGMTALGTAVTLTGTLVALKTNGGKLIEVGQSFVNKLKG